MGFGGRTQISPDTQSKLDDYLTNKTLPVQDALRIRAHLAPLNQIQIQNELLGPNFISLRCLSGYVGLVLISLAVIDRVHSHPPDHYKWGFIISRFVMGCFLTLLVLLNIGKQQTFWSENGGLNETTPALSQSWISHVFERLAVAFALQCIVEMILASFAKLAMEHARQGSDEHLAKLAYKSFIQSIGKFVGFFRCGGV